MHNIDIDLSSRSIDKAIKELKQFMKDVEKKSEQFSKLIAERIGEKAKIGFSGAYATVLINGTIERGDANISVTSNGNGSYTVTASGKDILFIEFGAGVYYNGSVGSSPHPEGSKTGMTIGSYGQGKGRKNSWGYYDDGELKITRGTPSVMPMFLAKEDVRDELHKIAKEVFK